MKKFLSMVIALVMVIGLLPTLPVAVASTTMVYLESDIMSTQRSSVTRYPASGSFSMGGVTYFRGITTDWGNISGSITYNIVGQGFTRLSGTFGRLAGTATGTLTITGDGRLLGGFEVQGGLTTQVDIAIPSDVQQIVIQMQPNGGMNDRVAFADAFFEVGMQSQQPPPQQEQPQQPLGNASYIESDIMSTQRSSVTRYPASGSFSMSGVTYFRGITTDWGNISGSITYNIVGQGFTRLSGTFGRLSGTATGTLTITGDGRLLGGFEVQGGVTRQVEVAIPLGIQQIVIQMQPNGGMNDRLAFADVFFDGGTASQPSTHPPATPNAIYLESDVMSTQRSSVTRYPASGSFFMGGVTYFRGITTDWGNISGSITYNIVGQGVTRLSGTFGRLSGTATGTLTITGDGRLLGGFEVQGGLTRQVDISIPSDIQQIVIQMQPNGGMNDRVAFAEVFFERTPQAPNIDTASTWARDGINEAYGKGIIPEELTHNFNYVINRQEFCRMAVRWVEFATGKSIDMVLSEKGLSRNPNAFTDTNDPDILAAFALGITAGVGNNQFNPLGQFTRQQAATMIMNACRAIGADVSNPPPSGFADMNIAASWAHTGINFVRANGIMSGVGNNNFNPNGVYSIQESIVTFNNIKHETLPGR
jgi:hypothetical protein